MRKYPSSLTVHISEPNPTQNSIENVKKSCGKALNILSSYESPVCKFMSGKDIDTVLTEFPHMDKYQMALVKKALKHSQRYQSLTTRESKKIMETN